MSTWFSPLTGFLTAVVIPIVAIVGGIAYATYSLYLRYRRQRETLQMVHAERMAAIEKGIELPPLPSELLHDRYNGIGYRSDRSRWQRGRALRMIFVGAAVTVAIWQTSGDHDFWWGLVIVAVGLARLASDYLDARGAAHAADQANPLPPGSTTNR
jgi:hypothetical protein